MFSSLIISVISSVAASSMSSINPDFSKEIKEVGFFDKYGVAIVIFVECLIVALPFFALGYFLLKIFFKLHGL